MMLNLLMIVASVLLNAAAQIFLKKGMMAIGDVQVSLGAVWELLPKLLTEINIWGGFACYAVSILLWLVVLSKVEVSYAYPFLSIGYIVTAFIGYYFLGESMSFYKVSGIAVICAGIVLMYHS